MNYDNPIELVETQLRRENRILKEIAGDWFEQYAHAVGFAPTILQIEKKIEEQLEEKVLTD